MRLAAFILGTSVAAACSAHAPSEDAATAAPLDASAAADGVDTAHAVAENGGGGDGDGADTPPAPPAPPAPTGDRDAPIPLWSALTRKTLPNGLTYYILPHARPAKRALMWLAVNAGSVLEDDDQRGLAHFCEHLAFNGTRRFPLAAIVDALESLGMRFGADLNAYTGWDETVYQLEVPSDDANAIGKGLDILRDWAADVTYDPAEIDKERRVVLEELRLGRGASQRIFEKQAPVIYAGTPYGQRLPIGSADIISGATRDPLLRFYRDWYRPDLQAVIVVGDIDPKIIEREIVARFADLPVPPSPRPRPPEAAPRADDLRISIEADAEAAGIHVAVMNTLPHRRESTPADLRRDLAGNLATLMLATRLTSLGNAALAPFSGASCSIASPNRATDMFRCAASPKTDGVTGRVEDSLGVLLTEVARAERHGFSARELAAAKADVAAMYADYAAGETTDQSRDFAQEITRNFFEGEAIPGHVAERTLALTALPDVTADEVAEVLRSFRGTVNRTITIEGPKPDLLPTRAAVEALAARVAASEPAPWHDAVADGPLVAEPPAPGKIVAERTIDAIGVTEWTLANGARVVVKPTDFEADKIAIAASSPGGLATVTDRDHTQASHAEALLGVGGVGTLDAERLTRALAGKSASAGVFVADTTEGVSASGAARDAETIFQLLWLRITHPRVDEAAIARTKAQMFLDLQDRLRTPMGRFDREVSEALYGTSERVRALTPRDVARLDGTRALAFHRARFGDVSDFTFVIVGDVTLSTLRPLVERWIGSLPGGGRIEEERDDGVRMRVGKKTWRLGEAPKASVQLWWSGDEPWSRDKERDLHILGEVLSRRLRAVLREDLGGVYGVTANGGIARAGHAWRWFGIRFGCAPERTESLIQATFDVIAAIANEGPSADELAKIRETTVRDREKYLRDNSFWLTWLERAYRFGDEATLVLDPGPLLARINPRAVQAAARHFLDRQRLFEVVLLPAR